MAKKLPFAKADFLTIPDAPNYEINGYFKVRNKTTGKFIKPYLPPRVHNKMVRLRSNGKKIHRTLKTLYHQALNAFSDKEIYYPIESVKNKYEMNCWGEVRNVSSKQFLKPYIHSGRTYYYFSIKGKTVIKSLDELALEVFFRNYRRKCRPVPVQLAKDGGFWRFNSMAAAARFIGKKVFYSQVYVANFFRKRAPEIFGYKVSYLG